MDTEDNRHVFRGKAFVLGDNIDTDQIIPAKYLNLVPTIPEEYEKLGSYALAGLPSGPPFVESGRVRTEYPIIVAGANFGCGSSREHAPIALGASGCRVVVARSFARIFFRNCIATGELYPVECSTVPGSIRTGDEIEVDLRENVLRLAPGAHLGLAPLGEALPVIDAGGLFEYSRRQGLIA